MDPGMTVDMIKTCRACGNRFYDEPLLRLRNMPRSAQHLPAAEALKEDRGVDVVIAQCAGCGLIQHCNEPVPYYRDVIRASAFSPEMRNYREKQFGDFVKAYSLKGKKILEVGCGRGEYLSVMNSTGADAYGIENDAASVSECKEAGLKAQKLFIDSSSVSIDNAPFDAFYILNYIEHLPDIRTVLGGLARNLTGGATGLIEVPNFDMMLRTGMFSEFISDHIFYFTKDTLSRTLGMNGFEVLRCSEVWHDYILSAEVRKREKPDLSGFELKRAGLRNELQAYISEYGIGRVAIWGAGHQALANISLLGLSSGVRYVVDSAPFKQGRYTPATHVRIVPPDTLLTEPVDAVIVMAASYSDEVVSIMKQRYRSVANIAVLREYGLDRIG
jgi:SAM-dependent methyltransferase